MAIPRDPGGAPRRRQPQTRRRPVVPHPEILRSAPPKPRLGPPRPTRRIGVFAKPVGRVSPVGNAPRRAAQRTRRAATRLPAEHQLPRFPVLRQYTDKQRQIIRSRTEQAVRKVATQRGIPGHRIVQTLYNEGDRHTRQTLRTYGRVVREQNDAQHAHALDSLLTTHIGPNLNALTAHERDQFRRSGTVRNPVSQEGKKLVSRQRTQARLRFQVDGARLGTSQRAAVYRALTAPRPSQARPGVPAPRRGTVATALGVVNAPLAAASARFASQLSASGATGLGGRALADFVNLPANVIPSAYALATQPGKTARTFVKTDPIALAVQGKFNEALKAASAHPGNTLLEVIPGLGAIDRAGGLALRRRLGTELQPVRSAPLTNLAGRQRYSKGLVMGAVQRGSQKHAARDYAALRNEARQHFAAADAAAAAGDHPTYLARIEAGQHALDRAELANPTRIRDRSLSNPFRQSDVRLSANAREGVGQARRRPNRTQVQADLLGTRAVRKSKRQPEVVAKGPESEVQGLLAQGVVKPTRADLKAHFDELTVAARSLRGDKLKANRDLRSAISKTLASHSDADLARLHEAAKAYSRVQRSREGAAVESRLLHPEEARTQRLRPYAVRNMGARYKDLPEALKPRNAREEHFASLSPEARQRVLTGLRSRNPDSALLKRLTAVHRAGGTYRPDLSTIEAHMRAHGVNPADVAFISHAPRSGQGAYNVRFWPAKGISTQPRTGQALLEGSATHGREVQVAGPVRLQGMVDAATTFREALSEAAVRLPNGKIATAGSRKAIEQRGQELMTGKDGLPLPGAVPLRAVRINPWLGREDQLAETIRHADLEGFTTSDAGRRQQHVLEAVADAWHGKDGPGQWALVPADYADQFARHAEVNQGGFPLLRTVTTAFRHTVLPFSPPWIAGNAIEANLRAAIAGAGPRSLITERRTIHKLASDPNTAHLADQYLFKLGSGHMGSTGTMHIRATSSQFADHALGPLVKAAQRVRDAKGVKQTVDALAGMFRAYTEWMFHSVNGRFETVIRRAMAGKYIRQNFMLGAGPKLAENAVREAAGQMGHAGAIDELVKYVQRAYGQYENFSPGIRRLLVNYTPFGAWTLNSIRFLTIVLPFDHPGLTALLAANDRATQQWRRDHGLDKGFATGRVPSFLLGAIPTPRWYADLLGVPAGGHVRVARFTPFGFGADPLGTIAQAVLPQFPLEALAGRDFTGKELKNPDGTPYTDQQRAAYAAKEFAFSTVPIIGQIARGAGKDGTLSARARQVLNPFEPSVKKTAAAKQLALPKGYKVPSDDVHDYSGAYNSSGSSVGAGGFDYSGAYGR